MSENKSVKLTKTVPVHKGDCLRPEQLRLLIIISKLGGSQRTNAFNPNAIEYARILVKRGYLEENERLEKKGMEFVITSRGREYLKLNMK